MKIFILLAALICLPIFSKASGLDGLAVSKDGKIIFTGGDSRVLYQLNGDLEVQKRTWMKSRIKKLILVKNDSVLFVYDGAKVLWAFEADSMKELKKFEKVTRFSYHPGNDSFVIFQGGYSDSEVKVVSLEKFEITASSKLPEKVRAAVIGFDPISCGAIVISEREKNDEKKISSSDYPKDLKGIDRDRFDQENDGYGTRLIRFSKKGGIVSDTKIAYSAGIRSNLARVGDDMILINYGDENLRIKSDNTVELFEVGSSGYGHGIIGNTFVLGGMWKGVWQKGDGTAVKFKIDHLPGFPEYFAGFSGKDDGNIFGSTSAYRIAKFGQDGKVIKIAPVF